MCDIDEAGVEWELLASVAYPHSYHRDMMLPRLVRLATCCSKLCHGMLMPVAVYHNLSPHHEVPKIVVADNVDDLWDIWR